MRNPEADRYASRLLAVWLGSTVLAIPFILSWAGHMVQDADLEEVVKVPPSNRSSFNLSLFEKELFSYSSLQATHLVRVNISELGQVADATYHSLARRTQSATYNDLLSHRYSSTEELMLSGGPEVDQEKCLAQLEHIIQRARIMRNEKSQSRDITINRLLDTFGRIPSNLYGGDSLWPGSYLGCRNLKLDMPDGMQALNYCLVVVQDPEWRPDWPIGEVIGYQIAVCLPKTCDSLDYKNKFDLIEQLINLNDAELQARGLRSKSLYCLPDEASTLRAWTYSPETKLTLIVLFSWLTILICATFCYEKQKPKNGPPAVASDEGCSKAARSEVNSATRFHRVVEALAITKNFDDLCRVEKAKVQDDHRYINLDCVDGVKTIAMMTVVVCHVNLVTTVLLSDLRNHFNHESMAYLIPYSLATPTVCTFFVITGLLTSYNVLIRNRQKSFINKPGTWLALIVSRYFQLVPMYLITTIFAKYLAKYLGSGPLWDYGTSDLTFRHNCERESLSWVLSLTSNFKPVLTHCIPAAWYLASDFQFLLITPLFIYLLSKKSLSGTRLLKLGVVLSYLFCAYEVYVSDIDLRPVAQTESHSVKVLSSFLNESYTWPHCRIGAYIIGLLLGYTLYKYDREVTKTMEMKSDGSDAMTRVSSKLDSFDKILAEPRSLKYHSAKNSLILLIMCVMQPILGWLSTATRFSAKTALVLNLPNNHLMASFGVGSYIVLAASGRGNKSLNRFLSWPYWKILSKLSLCVMLINQEVCFYIVLSKMSYQSYTCNNQISIYLTCIIGSYVASVLMHIAFEVPIKRLMLICISNSPKPHRSSKKLD